MNQIIFQLIDVSKENLTVKPFISMRYELLNSFLNRKVEQVGFRKA